MNENPLIDCADAEGANMGRRPFLTGAAALAAATALSSADIARAAGRAKYDVVVVGGGTTGMPLAIIAANRGARVLVVEKGPNLGGTLDRTYASTSAAGTEFQKAAGVVDSAADHCADVLASADNTADPALVKLWTDEAAGAVEWMVANGVKFNYKGRVAVSSDEVYRQPRMQFVVGQGKGLLAALQPAFDKGVASGKITLLSNASVVQLIQESAGAVTGSLISDSKGELQEVSAKNVVIATGGCHGSPQLYQELHSVPLYYAAGFGLNTGDGLMLGQSVGGYIRNTDIYLPLFGAVMAEDAIPSYPVDGTFQETTISDRYDTHAPWGIWVNAQGNRFVAEDIANPQGREHALRDQPGHRMWNVHDQVAADKGPSPMQGWDKDKYLAQFGKNSFFYKAATLDQLGLAAGVNPGALKENINAYNKALKAGAPDKFGRAIRPAPIEQGPFYAVRYQGYQLMTFAGLMVDDHLRVLRRDGAPVPNLYAAGEVLGAAAVGALGHAGGSAVTSCVAFAKVLGERILET